MKKICLGVLAVSAQLSATIIFVGTPIELSNSIQAATRVLEMQDGNDVGATAVGCIERTNANSDIEGACSAAPNVQFPGLTGETSVAQSLTRTLFDQDITGGADVRIVFDANEGGNPGNNPITLVGLRLILQNTATGAVIFFVDLDVPTVYASTEAGAGKADGLYKLAPASAAAFDLAVGLSGLASNMISLGLYARTEDDQGGPEAFHIGNANTLDPIPEPSTYALMATGLAALWFARRRNRRV